LLASVGAEGGEEGTSSGQPSVDEMGEFEQARVEAVQHTTIKPWSVGIVQYGIAYISLQLCFDAG
jgi:hypothetical protein